MKSPTEAGLTIYVVEDDAAMRDSLFLMLGLLGYRTVSFESVESSLPPTVTTGLAALSRISSCQA